MKKTAVFLMIIMIGSKIMGFVRDIVLSYYYGASSLSDSYLVAITIPTFIFAFVGAGIVTSYIPVANGNTANEKIEDITSYTNKVISLTVLISLVLIIFVFLFTEEIVSVFASGFSGEVLNQTILYTRICMFGILFLGVSYVLNGYLNLHSSFLVPAFSGVPLNIVIIASIIISSEYNNFLVLPYGTVIAMFFQYIFLYGKAKMEGFKYKLELNLKDKHVLEIVLLSLPVILGTSVNQLNVLVDRSIASTISLGGISALTYANRISLSTQEILVISMSTIMFPIISRLFSEKNFVEMKSTIEKAISYSVILLLPISLVILTFSKEIIEVLFFRGAFTKADVIITSKVLFFYSIGMFMFGLREILTKVFFAHRNTKIPTVNAFLAMLLNIILNIILSRFLGVPGLALATSITGIVSSVSLWYLLDKNVIKLNNLVLIQLSVKVFIVSIVSSFLSRLLFLKVFNSIPLILGLGFSITFAILIIIALILSMNIIKIQELKSYLKSTNMYT